MEKGKGTRETQGHRPPTQRAGRRETRTAARGATGDMEKPPKGESEQLRCERLAPVGERRTLPVHVTGVVLCLHVSLIHRVQNPWLRRADSSATSAEGKSRTHPPLGGNGTGVTQRLARVLNECGTFPSFTAQRIHRHAQWQQGPDRASAIFRWVFCRRRMVSHICLSSLFPATSIQRNYVAS